MNKIAGIFFFLSLFVSSCSGSKDYYAWNYPAALDSGGLVIEIGRVLLAEQGTFDDEFLQGPYFQDKPVIAEVIFVVRNNSGQTMSVFPDQGLVVVNGEQVDLYEASLNGRIGETVGGEILSGVTKIGGLWFGLRRSSLEDIKSMSIIISAPFDIYSNYAGGEYHFDIDLSERKSDTMPEELQ